MGTPLPQRTVKPKEFTLWYRWSRFIQHHPWSSAFGAAALLLVLAAPLTSIRLGFGDAGNFPTNTTVRRAYDMIAESFGPGFSGPLYITVQGEVAQSPSALRDFVSVVTSTEGVAFAQAVPASQDGTLALVVAYPTTSPQDEATTNLIHHLRRDVIPETGVEAKVGGFTAGGVDFASAIGDRMPYLFTGVLLLSFLLLMAVFRSVLVALKAVIMNLLSIGVAYGVIVFGLSMDYEVFLLSRVKEEYDRNWWIPAWMNRILPKIELERH